MQTQIPRTRFQTMLGWLPLIALAAICLFGFRMGTDHLETSPVAQVHAGFLDHLADQSAQARDYRERYYLRFERDTVASRHFEQVCASMIRLAIEDAVDPAGYSLPMAKACGQLARRHPGTKLPT